MFDIRRKGDDGQVISATYSAEKVTHIMLATGTSLSTDAIRLAMRHNVDIVFVEQSGDPIGRVWHARFGSTTKIRKTQLEASLGAVGVSWTKRWLLAKLDNQREFIKDLKKHRPQHADFLNDKISRIEAMSSSISTLDAPKTSGIADTLRGLEGTAGRLYFETLSYVLPAEYQFSGRSSRPAQDSFNAFLNYAYGMLYGRVEKALIVAGVDPCVGFLHRDDYNQLSMVYDFIEPYRIYAEEVVFRLFSAKKVNKSHISPVSAGGSRGGAVTAGWSLNQDGKKLLVDAFNEFMDGDKIRHGQGAGSARNLTRSHAIQADAHQFANQLIQ